MKESSFAVIFVAKTLLIKKDLEDTFGMFTKLEKDLMLGDCIRKLFFFSVSHCVLSPTYLFESRGY